MTDWEALERELEEYYAWQEQEEKKVEQLRIDVDVDVLRKLVSLARKPIARGCYRAVLLKMDLDRDANTVKVTLYSDKDHVHCADSHAWLPENVICVGVSYNPWMSREEARDEVEAEVRHYYLYRL